MSKTTSARAGDIYETARENPYVQRLIEDEDLRESLKDAFEAAKSAYGRATGNGKSTVQAVTSDKKVQKDLRKAAENLQEASERLREKRKRKGGIGRLLLIAIVGAVIALAISEGARKAVLDALFGAEEEFEYTSKTRINGSCLTASGTAGRRPRSLACGARHASCVLAQRSLSHVSGRLD